MSALPEKKRLLLHVCCAPCSTQALTVLAPYFFITAYYDNPNIDTAEEYERRAQEQRRLARQSGLCDVVVAPFEPQAFYDAAKGHEKDKEGGERCKICYALRLKRALAYAERHGYDFLTTSLTVSPLKDAAALNDIGQRLCQDASVQFLPSDFKKKNGYLASVALSKAYGLYRQDYCGCIFSKLERDEQKRQAEQAKEKR